MSLVVRLTARGWVLLEVAIGVRDEPPLADAIGDVPFGFAPPGGRELEHDGEPADARA